MLSGDHGVGVIVMGVEDAIAELSMIFKPDGSANLPNLGTSTVGDLVLDSVSEVLEGGTQTLWFYYGELAAADFNPGSMNMVCMVDFGDTSILPGYLVEPGPGRSAGATVEATMRNGLMGIGANVFDGYQATVWDENPGRPGLRYSYTDVTPIEIVYDNSISGGLLPNTRYWVIYNGLNRSLYDQDGNLLASGFAFLGTLQTPFTVFLSHTEDPSFPALLGAAWWRDNATYTSADFPRLYAEYLAA